MLVSNWCFAVDVVGIFNIKTHKEIVRETVNTLKMYFNAKNISFEILDSSEENGGTGNAFLEAKKLNPKVIIAETDSSKAMVISKLSFKNKIISVTPFASNPSIISKDNPWMFRTCFFR